MRLGGSESSDRDWFDLSVAVSVDGEDVPFADLFVALAEGRSHLILPSGTYFSLDRDELRQLAELIAEARTLGDGVRRQRPSQPISGQPLGGPAAPWGDQCSGSRLGGLRASAQRGQQPDRARRSRRPGCHAPALSADRLQLVGLPLRAPARRSAGRRHGAREDHPGVGADVPHQGAWARRVPVPGGGPDERRRELGVRVPPVRPRSSDPSSSPRPRLAGALPSRRSPPTSTSSSPPMRSSASSTTITPRSIGPGCSSTRPSLRRTGARRHTSGPRCCPLRSRWP